MKRVRTPMGQWMESILQLPMTLALWVAAGLGAWTLHESRPVTQEFFCLLYTSDAADD